MALEEKIAKLAIGGLVGERAYAHGGGFYVCRPEDMKRQDGVFNDEDDAVAFLAKLRAQAILAVIRAEAQDEGAAGVRDNHRYAVVSANFSRPFMAGAYPTFERAQLAQCGSPEKWLIYQRCPAHPSPPPAADADRVLVPLEPTPEMHAAGVAVTEKKLAPSWTALEVYRAMTRAALKSTAAKEES